MTKRLLWISVFIFYGFTLHAESYVTQKANEITLGNSYVEQVFTTSDHTVETTAIHNKLSGTVYSVSSNEFALRVDFSGMGPAYSKDQNGENPVILTDKDFEFQTEKTQDLENGGKELSLLFAFNNAFANFRVKVVYTVYPNDKFMRKWLEISDEGAGLNFLDKVYVESLTFDITDFSHGQFGQPVFDRDIFLGVEYPTVENKIKSGKVDIGYIVGKKITREVYKTHTGIVGVAPSATKLENTFMDYVDQIKVKGTRPFLLYNSWYDMRRPSLVKDSISVMNETNTLDRIQSFHKYMSKYGINLNTFVLDDGWDNVESVWKVDSTRFPHGFTPVENALKKMNSSLGLWASPFGGYEDRQERADYAKSHGYETTGDFLCFAGTKYKHAMETAMQNFTRNYNTGYFKWDGFLLTCNETDHGHLPGIYSREAFVSTYIAMMDSVRKINPDIFLNITTGTWLSPWWLKYADCIWMQGADYAYAENVPCVNERDKAITYKDEVLWTDLQKQDLLFPVSSLMTHGIIQGRLNLLGGKDETFESFSNEVMMYFGRGVMMWELYVTPDLLSDTEWNAIATAVKWAKSNKDVLQKSRMILGNPFKREVYGYLHMTKRKGILLLRNPAVQKSVANFKFSGDLGDIDPNTEYQIKIVYPYNYILPDPVKLDDEINIPLDGYEILTAELIPVHTMNKALPVGIKYSVDHEKLTVYGEAGSHQKIQSVSNKKIADIRFDGKTAKIQVDKHTAAINNQQVFDATYNLTLPPSYKNTQLALLFEPKQRGKSATVPKTDIRINGMARKVFVKQQNGKWFWIFADLDSLENNISCNIQLDPKFQWKSSAWVFAKEQLSTKNVGTLPDVSNEILPIKPIPAELQKVIFPLDKD